MQGGPGATSLYGVFENNGPMNAVFEDDADTTKATLNPYSWHRIANMIYVDNPIGTGFSFADSGVLHTNQSEVADDLYEFLRQFFTLFSEFQANDFYAMGQSYGGKWTTTICKRIHDMNQISNFKINLVGFGVGSGFISPEEQVIYADFLYKVSNWFQLHSQKSITAPSFMCGTSNLVI